jgi:2-keto-4-pentenoate hydratase/2-oxohepta-3-ene-1,7-dioic acid hydratase in catechol pathway
MATSSTPPANPEPTSSGSAPGLAGVLAGAPWGLVSYPTADGSHPAGVLGRDGVVRRLESGAAGMLSLLGRWDELEAELADLDPGSLEPVAGAAPGLPIAYPPKIVCAGANYRSHVKEMGGDPPPPGVGPYFFFKPPTTALIADGEAVEIGAWEGGQADWEAELGVVIGRRISHATREEALDAIAAYTVLNDVTDRSRLHRMPSGGPPFTFDWFSSKARDRSCPIGTALIPAFLVEDPADLPVRLWVNADLKQDSTTADMIFDIADLLTAANEIVTLEPGDIVATGTPAGVGRPRGEFLAPGDTVTVEIEGVGRMRTGIVA